MHFSFWDFFFLHHIYSFFFSPFYVNRMRSHLKIEMHYITHETHQLTKDFYIYRRFGCSLFNGDVWFFDLIAIYFLLLYIWNATTTRKKERAPRIDGWFMVFNLTIIYIFAFRLICDNNKGTKRNTEHTHPLLICTFTMMGVQRSIHINVVSVPK